MCHYLCIFAETNYADVYYQALTLLIHQTFYSGYEMIVMLRYNFEDYCRFVQEHKATMGYLVPPIILQLARDPSVSKYDLSSLRMVNGAAAPLSKELSEAFLRAPQSSAEARVWLRQYIMNLRICSRFG